MAAELILTGNGPGELTGWIAPVARAARPAAHEQGLDLRLTLALTPSQFAAGREEEVARRWGLFERVLAPGHVARAALGLERLAHEQHAALVHLGGELWISGRLAARLGIAACAIAETDLIARRHRLFSRIFAVSPSLPADLRRRGVPAEKIIVCGDPRGDALAAAAERASVSSQLSGLAGPILAILPGSRDRLFASLAPYFLAAAAALRDRLPQVEVRIIASELLSPALVAGVQREEARRRPALPVRWITDDPWTALAGSDFAMTIPGTNTLELAMLGLPFAVVVDLDLLDRAPLEGLVEWLTRIPAGRFLRRAVVRQLLARRPFVALPNARAGRLVVPEWIGRWTADELAKRVAELLNDSNRRAAMRATLQDLFPVRGGASRAIAQTALALATAAPAG